LLTRGAVQERESTGATRRGFVAGAAAGAAAQLLGRSADLAGAAAKAPARCAGRLPGTRRNALAVSHDGRTVWTADTGADTITAHRARDLSRRRSIVVGDGPTGIALAPGGARALVTTGFYDEPGLAIVDLHAGKVISRLDVGAVPGAIALAPDGRTAVVASGGAKGRLTRVDLGRGRVMARVDVGRHPRGVAVMADGRHAVVALNGDAAVAVVRLRDDHIVAKITTAPFPFLIAAAPAGDRAFVSHNGFGARSVTRLDVGARRTAGQLRTGAEPAGLAFTRGGALVVATRGDGAVTILDPRSGARRRRARPGGRPRAVAVQGRRAFSADEQTGQLWAIRV
jgi:DNA-binding beta-propeller fold protein YncE